MTLMMHLINTPQLPEHLSRIHDIAFYESGDFVIGADEKESFRETMRLINLLEDCPIDELRTVLKICDKM